MKISIASYSFHGLTGQGMMDIFGYLETVKYRYRLDAADVWSGTLAAGLTVPAYEAEHLKRVKEALDERELVVANYHVDGVHVWEDDPAKREHNYREALAHLAAGAFLGAQTMRIDMGGAGDTFTDEQLAFVAGRYREYAQFAADHGFTVGPETHWGPSLNPATQQAVYDAVNHPGYGVLLHAQVIAIGLLTQVIGYILFTQLDPGTGLAQLVPEFQAHRQVVVAFARAVACRAGVAAAVAGVDDDDLAAQDAVRVLRVFDGRPAGRRRPVKDIEDGADEFVKQQPYQKVQEAAVAACGRGRGREDPERVAEAGRMADRQRNKDGEKNGDQHDSG